MDHSNGCLSAAHKVNAEIIQAVNVAIRQYLSGDNSDKSNEQYSYGISPSVLSRSD